jgi:hypothetical protein
MASTFQWTTPDTIASALTTELNTLTNGSYSAASGAIDNETGLFLYVDVELSLASLNPTGTPSCSLFIVKSVDAGSNFEDGGGATAPANEALLCSFSLSTGASTKRRVVANLLIPPLQFKFVLLNNTGVSTAASGNTVRYRRHNEQGT